MCVAVLVGYVSAGILLGGGGFDEGSHGYAQGGYGGFGGGHGDGEEVQVIQLAHGGDHGEFHSLLRTRNFVAMIFVMNEP